MGTAGCSRYCFKPVKLGQLLHDNVHILNILGCYIWRYFWATWLSERASASHGRALFDVSVHMIHLGPARSLISSLIILVVPHMQDSEASRPDGSPCLGTGDSCPVVEQPIQYGPSPFEGPSQTGYDSDDERETEGRECGAGGCGFSAASELAVCVYDSDPGTDRERRSRRTLQRSSTHVMPARTSACLLYALLIPSSSPRNHGVTNCCNRALKLDPAGPLIVGIVDSAALFFACRFSEVSVLDPAMVSLQSCGSLAVLFGRFPEGSVLVPFLLPGSFKRSASDFLGGLLGMEPPSYSLMHARVMSTLWTRPAYIQTRDMTGRAGALSSQQTTRTPMSQQLTRPCPNHGASAAILALLTPEQRIGRPG
jgi:hypothetical protein